MLRASVSWALLLGVALLVLSQEPTLAMSTDIDCGWDFSNGPNSPPHYKGCPNELCCSSNGTCGNTPNHCAAGTQGQGLALKNDDWTCGFIPMLPLPIWKHCQAPYCCSKYGYCGNTAEHCRKSNGCQFQCWDNGVLRTTISNE